MLEQDLSSTICSLLYPCTNNCLLCINDNNMLNHQVVLHIYGILYFVSLPSYDIFFLIYYLYRLSVIHLQEMLAVLPGR